MAKITRATQKVFCDGVSATNNIAQFGSLKAEDIRYSKDPSVLQELAAFGEGWAGAVMINNAPTMQDFNGMFYLITRQIAYLLQQGVPEYDATTTYYQYSIVADSGVLYISKVADNVGNATNATAYWARLLDFLTENNPDGLVKVQKTQFVQRASAPDAPASGYTEFYVKQDGVAYLKGSDGTENPVGSGSTVGKVTQASHGFIVGTPLDKVGTDWVKADAEAGGNNEARCMVSRVVDTETFEYVTNGIVKGLVADCFTEGVLPAQDAECWLSTTPGKLTITPPNTVGQIDKPCFFVTANNTTTVDGIFENMRGTTVGGTNLYTTIPLQNGTATSLQSLAGDTTFPINSGGFIEGFVTIDTSTTDYIFTFKVEYTKTGSTTIRVTPSYGAGDVPPGLTITDSGANIQINWTSLSGFNSASARFSMQAAAAGATLPLQISPALISGAADIACTSGYGISFGNETLKNYDEGTWTPTDASGAGLSITVTRGKYTRIGNVCYYNAVVTYPATADATNAKITLPIATTDASAVGGVLEAAGTAIQTLVGSSGMSFYNASGAVRTNANLASKTLYISGWYNIV